MGGRGGSSGLVRTRKIPQPQNAVPPVQSTPFVQSTPAVQPQQQRQAQQQQPTPPVQQQRQAQQQQQQPIQNQVPNANNTPVTPNATAQFKNMSDAQLAQLYTKSQNAKLPNHLNDVDDKTQKFIFTIGMNDKPLVLDQAAFKQFMTDNNIPQSQIMSRSINGGQLNTSAGGKSNLTPQDIVDMMKYSRLNYIGGKIGGQAYGAGMYLDMNGGRNTGYGHGATLTGVLNPNTAKVVTDTRLASLARAFDRTHPQFARATGGYSDTFHNNNMSIYATVLGFNVIKDSTGSYHTVIDRKAIVLLK